MKIAVIGGGLLGISSAYVLQNRGYEVTLLETRETLASETSFAPGGMLTASMSDPWNSPGVYKYLLRSLFDPYAAMRLHMHTIPSLLFWGFSFLRNSSFNKHLDATLANYSLAQYSLKKTREIREFLSLTYDHSITGDMKVFRDEKKMIEPRRIAKKLQEFGLEFFELDKYGAVEVEPSLDPIRDKIAGALFFPQDECGDAYKFCCQLSGEMEKIGVEVKTNFAAIDLKKKSNKIIGINTSDGFFPINNVVVAAGNSSAKLMKNLGVSIPIKPVKGYSATLDVRNIKNVPKLAIVDDAMHAAVIPLGQRLRLAGTAEFAGFNTEVNSDRIDGLFTVLEGLYPNISAEVDKNNVETWTGLRPMSSDGKPFIGPGNIEGLYLNTGHGHLGWTMAMGSAWLLADLIEGKDPEIASLPFSPAR